MSNTEQKTNAGTLYIYDSCPYCIRVLMLQNYAQIPLTIKIVTADDEATPKKLIGKKMVPILERNGHAIGESLDICKVLNDELPQSLQLSPQTKNHELLNSLINGSFMKNTFSLLFPRLIQTNLFKCYDTEEAKQFIINTKIPAVFNGKSIDEITAEYPIIQPALEKQFEEIPDLLTLPSENDNKLTWTDIIVFPNLLNLTLVKGFKFPQRVQQYINEVSALTNLPVYTAHAL